MNLPVHKSVLNWNSEYIFMHLLVFISKKVQFLQFSKNNFQKNGLKLYDWSKKFFN